MAPISLAILNPIAFVLMEFGKQQEAKQKLTPSSTEVVESSLLGNDNSTGEEFETAGSSPNGRARYLIPEVPSSSEETSQDAENPGCSAKRAKVQLKLLGSVVRSIVSNPVVFMTVLGIIGNFFYQYLHFVAGILQVCEPFSALFYLYNLTSTIYLF